MAHIGITGGGIIGCATALTLLERGHRVTVFERDINGLPASAGNAGILAVPEIEPLSRPEMLLAAPLWLMDPLGPLTLRWRDLPALAPWLLHFAWSARPSQFNRSKAALLFLMKTALADHQAMAAAAGLSGHMRQSGALAVFDDRKKLDAAFIHENNNAVLLGQTVEKLDENAARNRVPALEGRFAGALFSGGYQTFLDPLGLLRHLQNEIRGRGTLVEAAVEAVAPSGENITIMTGDGQRHQFDQVVVASGVWSRELVRTLGLKVRLETERGYNTTFNNPSVMLEHPVFFADHGFVATPMDNALRIGGAVELARPDAPANFKRAEAMRRKMRRYVPTLPEEGGREWMGCRPSTPDSVPVISLHPQDRRIAFAFGHGHVGLTLSATTGRHIADLLEERPGTSLDAFSIARFR